MLKLAREQKMAMRYLSRKGKVVSAHSVREYVRHYTHRHHGKHAGAFDPCANFPKPMFHLVPASEVRLDYA